MKGILEEYNVLTEEETVTKGLIKQNSRKKPDSKPLKSDFI